MSKIVNVKTPQEMYESFMDIYPEFRIQCCGFNVFTWENTLRKILINLSNIDMKILFSVRKSDETRTWDQYSALLVPAPDKEEEPDPDEGAEVDISEDL